MHCSTWPLSRTKPTTITCQVGEKGRPQLRGVLAKTTALVGDTQVPLRMNRVVREVTVWQGGVMLYERKDEVTTGNLAEMESLSLSSAEWSEQLLPDGEVWVDYSYYRHWGTHVDSRYSGANIIFGGGPNVPVEALAGRD
jgi:hypothetical protein